MLEIAKITGEEWKNMGEKEKAPYEQASFHHESNEEQNSICKRKQKKEEEAANLKKDKDEFMKRQKQEAMQLLKKKEKTETIIKKNKENSLKKKNGEKSCVDPNKPKKPASSFFLFSKETRKSLAEERPGINNSTLTALISVKWKEITEEEKKMWNEKAAEAMEAYKKELVAYNEKLAAEEAEKEV